MKESLCRFDDSEMPHNNAIPQTRHHDDLVSPLPLCGLVMARIRPASGFLFFIQPLSILAAEFEFQSFRDRL
jgi:hypothetical protein